jgi:hypothetical protein
LLSFAFLFVCAVFLLSLGANPMTKHIIQNVHREIWSASVGSCYSQSRWEVTRTHGTHSNRKSKVTRKFRINSFSFMRVAPVDKAERSHARRLRQSSGSRRTDWRRSSSTTTRQSPRKWARQTAPADRRPTGTQLLGRAQARSPARVRRPSAKFKIRKGDGETVRERERKRDHTKNSKKNEQEYN